MLNGLTCSHQSSIARYLRHGVPLLSFYKAQDTFWVSCSRLSRSSSWEGCRPHRCTCHRGYPDRCIAFGLLVHMAVSKMYYFFQAFGTSCIHFPQYKHNHCLYIVIHLLFILSFVSDRNGKIQNIPSSRTLMSVYFQKSVGYKG